jgi:hypothetical protein
MTATAESTAKTAPEPEARGPAMLAHLSHKTIEKFVEIQKVTLDLAVQQSATVTRMFKQGLSMAGLNPVAALFDLGQGGVAALAESQKGILDLAVQQSAQATSAYIEQADMLTGKLAESAREMGDRLVEAQRAMFDFAAKQNAVLIDMLSNPAGQATAAPMQMLVDTYRQGMEMLMKMQRQLLDVASKPPTAKAAGA